MRLIDADELIEHAYRDRLDSRELIAAMINNAPTVKKIPVNVPLSLIIKALEQEGHWKRVSMDKYTESAKYWYKCDKCGEINLGNTNFCPNCGCKMEG